MCLKTWIMKSTRDYSQEAERLKRELEAAEALVIGAGAGLSASAGFSYSGERFYKYFADFIEKYGFRDMYSGGFYSFAGPEEFWAYWSRYIYINRYMDIPKDTYQILRKLTAGKKVQILTTNVDHCFQKAGFDKERLFYTQGDYGLFQCSEPCHQRTYDNEAVIRKMMEAQGYVLTEGGEPYIPEGMKLKMEIPAELIPHCPVCGRPVSMNLRSDGSFVEDDGWHKAAGRYEDFLARHKTGKTLFLELGVGYNTPGIIKYPFWQMTAGNPKAIYACVNDGEAFCPKEIEGQAICIDGDIGEALLQLI